MDEIINEIRTDVQNWKYLVHLTSNTTDNYKSYENLLQILIEKRIIAFNSNFIFYEDAEKLPDQYRQYFKTVSFTEIPGRDLLPFIEKGKRFSEFGIVFKKDFIIDKGGNPVFYITNKEILKYLTKMWKNKLHKPKELIDYSNFIIRFSLYNSNPKNGYSFHFWKEREWRMQGDLEFKFSDVEFLYLPNKRAFWDFVSYDPYFKKKLHQQELKQLMAIETRSIHFEI